MEEFRDKSSNNNTQNLFWTKMNERLNSYRKQSLNQLRYNDGSGAKMYEE